MKVIALIVAGGEGQRFDDSIPKQYYKLGNSSILKTTISKFTALGLKVQVVIRPEDQQLYDQLNEHLLPVCFAGESRSDSVRNGLQAIAKYNPDLVLVHDACRPYLSPKLIKTIIDKLKEADAVVPVLKASETVKRIDDSSAQQVMRDNLFFVQTPQGFNFKKLYDLSLNEAAKFTDESSLFEAHNLPVTYIKGERSNIKITQKEDIIMTPQIRSGIGFDAHKFAPEINEQNFVVLGGINIPFKQKIEAHSDGDVLIHALVDAILGAIAQGDIGMHFPPSDPKWKGMSSEHFLKIADEMMKAKNGQINNIDITVICEYPRIGKYREEIINNLARILNISKEQINIKGTTTEKMGFTGRGEGIAVQAIVTITL